jgi:16S rRNA (adenine1518-N6/adenine1519-N6)-dimethyltransferase
MTGSFLMFQREVAERIVAKPGSKTYAGSPVLTGWRAGSEILFDIAPPAFVPPPVTSSLVQLAPRRAPPALRSRRARARHGRRSASAARCCARA